MSQKFLTNDFVVAVFGAGVMGSQIAQKYATHGYSVVLIDKSCKVLNLSKSNISNMLDQAVFKGKFSEVEAKAIFSRLRFSEDIKDAKHANLIIEAISEDLKIKQDLFKTLEEVCAKETVLATNTSSFKVADLQKELDRKERVLGLHYFFPAVKNRLVEIVHTELTSVDTINKAIELQKSLNKVVIQSKDSPGFIVNRFFVPWLNEAARMVHERFSNFATVETAAKKFFNISMGPFALMNATGVPIALHSSNTLFSYFGDFYAPCPLIADHVELNKQFDVEGLVEEEKFHAISQRLLFVVSAICCQMVFEEKICTLSDVDLSAQVGLLWQKGPFELFNENLLNIKNNYLKMKKTTNTLPIPPIFLDHMKKSQIFTKL